METKENSGSILDLAKETVSSLTEKVLDLKDDLFNDEQSEILSEFKEAGLVKMKISMEQISDSLGLLSKSGYDFRGMDISMGIPPSLSTVFLYEKEISEEERIKLQEEAKGKRIVEIILKCLFKANEFYHSVNIGNYKIDKVKITLGLSPGMSLSFDKK
jgi:hypothetical protein